jgi:polyisoprenyl-phosphate glycosyltransferase
MKLSIVIPCYNESDSINLLIDKLLKILKNNIEIILVDNGSIDGTYNKLISLNLPKNIKVVRVIKNLGYGNGIIQGLKSTKGEIVAWTHADLQTDPRDVIKCYKEYEQDLIDKKCIVKGKRKKRSFKEQIITLGMSLYCSVILNEKLVDINAQPKLFHRSFIDLLDSPPLDFSLDLYLLYFFKKQNVRINSIPVYFDKRLHGEAKGGGSSFFGKMRVIINTIKYVHKLKKEF